MTIRILPEKEIQKILILETKVDGKVEVRKVAAVVADIDESKQNQFSKKIYSKPSVCKELEVLFFLRDDWLTAK